MEDRLRVGVITSPHGIHGEVKIFPTTDDPQRFKKLKKVIVDTHKEQKEMEIGGIKFFKNLVIATLSGSKTEPRPRSTDRLIFRLREKTPFRSERTSIIYVISSDLPSQTTTVLFSGLSKMFLRHVPMTCMSLRENGKEILIPSTKECVLSTDLNSKNIVVHLLKGMI